MSRCVCQRHLTLIHASVTLFLLSWSANPALAQDKAASAPPSPAEKTPAPIAPDIVPRALWDGRKIVPFRALDFPKMVRASEADFLDDGDYVLGTTLRGESRAYPTRFIWWHHVINDKIGKAETGGEEPVAITYCSVCNTGIGYDRTLNGRPMPIDFYGLYNGVVTLCERDSASVLLQVEGRFVTGPLLGARLKPVPVLDTTWGQWRKLHPDTLVMSLDTPYQKHYSPRTKPEPRDYSRFPAPFFRPSMTRTDKRLPFFEKVLALAVPASNSPAGGESPILRRAYPLSALKQAGGVVNDTLGNRPVAAFLEPESMTATAVSRDVDGKTLSFEGRSMPDGKRAIFDRETGTRWDLEGRGEAGPLKGKSLARLECHLSQWYGWVAYFPDTSIYGRNDPPQPVDMTSVQPQGE